VKPGQRVTPTGFLVAASGVPEDEWRDLRRTGIGGSDVGALLGMDRYTSPYELYLDKRGELPDLPRSEALDRAARWGHLHEPLIAAEFARQHQVRTRRIGLIRHCEDAWRLANLDRQVTGCPGGGCGLEIKNRSAWKASEWGQSGDPDGVPDSEALQTHHYLAVTGYRHFHVAVLINGNDDRYYRVERDESLIADVVALEKAFWQRVHDADPPLLDGSAAVSALLADLWAGDEGSEVVLGETAERLLRQRDELRLQAKKAAAGADEAENRLKGLIGTAETARLPDGSAVTWKRTGTFASRKFRAAHPDLAAKYEHLVPGIDTAALKADHPDTYRAFRARVLRVSAGGHDGE
jgi:putative phage-type endonuclease